jgi:hypothetical protein
MIKNKKTIFNEGGITIINFMICPYTYTTVIVFCVIEIEVFLIALMREFFYIHFSHTLQFTVGT